MTDLRKAAEMALEALESAANNEGNFHDYKYAANALRQALAQQALADSIRPKGKSITKVWVDEINQALAQPEQSQTSGYAKKIESLIKERDELRQQLAKGEQEPVARVVLTQNLGLPTMQWLDLTRQFVFKGGEFLYTAPPSKPWVSLTDEEIDYIWGITKADYEDKFEFPRAIEAKLKEKNNG